jgi:hypothetical protein
MPRVRMIPTPWQRVALLLLTVLLLLVSSGCYRTTPPGPDTAGGKFEGAAYVFCRWKQGLRLMIWHDATGATSSGSGSTSDPVYRVEGQAVNEGHHGFTWALETRDGQTAQFRINDVSYDLSEGTLFLVSTSGSSTGIEQLRRDLSGVQPNRESILAFATDDPDVARFIEDARQ